MPFSEPPLVQYNYFINSVHASLLDASRIPSHKSRSVEHKTSPIWWNSECTSLCKQRRQAFLRFKSTLDPQLLLDYRILNAKTRRATKEAKRKSWRGFCSTFNRTTPIPEVWRAAKAFRSGQYPKRFPLPVDLLHDFADSVAPSYVPEASEVHITFNSVSVTADHFLNLPISVLEFTTLLKRKKKYCPGTRWNFI